MIYLNIVLQNFLLEPDFFKEIDASIKKNCRNVNMVNGYFFQFQRFNESLMMAVSNELKYTMRIPFKKMLYTQTEAAISNILTKNDWKDAAMFKAVNEGLRHRKRRSDRELPSVEARQK